MRSALLVLLLVPTVARADASVPKTATPLHFFDFEPAMVGGPLLGWAPRPWSGEHPIAPLVGMYMPVGGSCDGAPTLGDVSRYATPLRVNRSGARVRSRALFDAETNNVIGALPGGAEILAEGPLKDAEFSDGVGWAIIFSDGQRSCRGYVSDSVVHPR
jgi:hypothetical protein